MTPANAVSITAYSRVFVMCRFVLYSIFITRSSPSLHNKVGEGARYPSDKQADPYATNIIIPDTMPNREEHYAQYKLKYYELDVRR